ncbi:MAG: alpha/beta fold hydrolase [Actinomycetota bacterium]
MGGRTPVSGAALDPPAELVRSFDGTFIAARRSGDESGAPMLLCTALGVGFALWRRLLAELDGTTAMALTWDHRGFFESGTPASERLDAGVHAEDAVAVLEHHAIEHCHVVAWSNGARVALEIVRRYPERVAGLALICGGYGHPLDRLVAHFELASLLPAAAGIGKRFGPLLQIALRAATARPELAGVIRQSGLLAPTADATTLVEILRALAGCDLGLYLGAYEALMQGGDAALLDGIDAPTLLVAGERDPFTSLALMQEMASAIPAARLEVYAGATHYVPIEYPERLAQDLTTFLTPPSGS